MSVAAGAAVPGALAVLAGTGEPNVVVTHRRREESESGRNIDHSLLAFLKEGGFPAVRVGEETTVHTHRWSSAKWLQELLLVVVVV